jgi:transposase
VKVALWAEIRRLAEIEKLSGWAIARRLHCSRHTVAKALKIQQPPAPQAPRRASLLDSYLEQIKSLLAKYPDLSAVRIREEIARGPQGYTGSTCILRRYLRHARPARGRVYQEVHYQPAQAMQVDWGECGRVQVGSTTRKVSVLVAVLCYSRLAFIEFTLSQRKPEFYRGLVNALTFFGGSPRNLIFDNAGVSQPKCFAVQIRELWLSCQIARLDENYVQQLPAIFKSADCYRMPHHAWLRPQPFGKCLVVRRHSVETRFYRVDVGHVDVVAKESRDPIQ